MVLAACPALCSELTGGYKETVHAWCCHSLATNAVFI